MKKAMMIAALMGGMLFTAGAQTQKANNQQPKQEMTSEQQADRQIAKYESELNLSATQRTKVKGYLVERINAVKPLREKAQAAATREERKTYTDQIKVHNEKCEANIKAVLTADQFAKYQAKQAEMKSAKAKKQGNK